MPLSGASADDDSCCVPTDINDFHVWHELLLALGVRRAPGADAYSDFVTPYFAVLSESMQLMDMVATILIVSALKFRLQHPECQAVLVAAATSWVLALAWLVVPSRTYRWLAVHSRWPRQLSYIAYWALLSVCFKDTVPTPVMFRYLSGTSILTFEATIIPIGVLVSPLESVVVALAKGPLYVRTWRTAGVPFSAASAVRRASMVGLGSFLTTLLAHLALRLAFHRSRTARLRAKAAGGAAVGAKPATQVQHSTEGVRPDGGASTSGARLQPDAVVTQQGQPALSGRPVAHPPDSSPGGAGGGAAQRTHAVQVSRAAVHTLDGASMHPARRAYYAAKARGASARPVKRQADVCAAPAPAPCGAARSSPSTAPAASRSAVQPAQPCSAADAASLSGVKASGQASSEHQPHIPYHSRTRLHRATAKIDSHEPEDAAAGYEERMRQLVERAGLRLQGVHLRRGCIELVVEALELVNSVGLQLAAAQAAPMDLHHRPSPPAPEPHGPAAAAVPGPGRPRFRALRLRKMASSHRRRHSWEFDSDDGGSSDTGSTDGTETGLDTGAEVLDLNALIQALELPDAGPCVSPWPDGFEWGAGRSGHGAELPPGGGPVAGLGRHADVPMGSGPGTPAGEDRIAVDQDVDSSAAGQESDGAAQGRTRGSVGAASNRDAGAAGACQTVYAPCVADVQPRVLHVHGGAVPAGPWSEPGCGTGSQGGDWRPQQRATLAVVLSWVTRASAAATERTATEGAAASMPPAPAALPARGLPEASGEAAAVKVGGEATAASPVRILLRKDGVVVASVVAERLAQPEAGPGALGSCSRARSMALRDDGTEPLDFLDSPMAPALAHSVAAAQGAEQLPWSMGQPCHGPRPASAGGEAPDLITRHNLDVHDHVCTLRPGLLLVEAVDAPDLPKVPAAGSGDLAAGGKVASGAPSMVPVLLVSDPWVAAELQAAAEAWRGGCEELDDLLYDMGALLGMLHADASRQGPCGAAAAAAAADAAGDRGAATGAACTHGMPQAHQAAKAEGLCVHLSDYAEQMGWQCTADWLRESLRHYRAAAAWVGATDPTAVSHAGAPGAGRDGASTASAASYEAAPPQPPQCERQEAAGCEVRLPAEPESPDSQRQPRAEPAAAAEVPNDVRSHGEDQPGGTEREGQGAACRRTTGLQLHGPPGRHAGRRGPAQRPLSDAAAAVAVATSGTGEAQASDFTLRRSSRSTLLLLWGQLLLALGLRRAPEQEARAYEAFAGPYAMALLQPVQALELLATAVVICKHGARSVPIVVCGATSLVLALLWPLLPRRRWRQLFARSKWLRQLCILMGYTMVAFMGYRLPQGISEHQLSPALLLAEGCLVPAASLVTPGEALLLAALKVPLFSRMWLLSGVPRTAFQATLRAAVLCGSNVLTTVSVHVALRLAFQRHQAKREVAKAE